MNKQTNIMEQMKRHFNPILFEMTNPITRRTAACLIVAVTVLSSIPAVCVAKTPHAAGTLGKGDFGVMDDTPYYGGFGAGFLHINAEGTYGGGEIRSGDLGLRFLPGVVTWGSLDYSCVEPDCDQKFVLTFERPFELEFLGVRNSGKPTVQATQGGKKVRCSVKAVNADEYEVRFDKPLKLDAKPLEIRIGSN